MFCKQISEPCPGWPSEVIWNEVAILELKFPCPNASFLYMNYVRQIKTEIDSSTSQGCTTYFNWFIYKHDIFYAFYVWKFLYIKTSSQFCNYFYYHVRLHKLGLSGALNIGRIILKLLIIEFKTKIFKRGNFKWRNISKNSQQYSVVWILVIIINRAIMSKI